MLVSLRSAISLKLNRGFERFISGSNLHPQSVTGTLDVNEFTAEMIKSGVYMEQPSGIKASGGLMVLLSV